VFDDVRGGEADRVRIPPADEDRAIEEGLLVARAALVLAVRNWIIVRALRDRAPFSVDDTANAVRRELARLASEQEGYAMRAGVLRRRAARLIGRARHQHDYGADDEPVLRQRQAVHIGLARELTAYVDDPEYIDDIVRTAHGQAMEDVGVAILNGIGWTGPRDANYDAEREDRLGGLRTDLRRLRWRQL
jgi:hypothetical protein